MIWNWIVMGFGYASMLVVAVLTVVLTFDLDEYFFKPRRVAGSIDDHHRRGQLIREQTAKKPEDVFSQAELEQLKADIEALPSLRNNQTQGEMRTAIHYDHIDERGGRTLAVRALIPITWKQICEESDKTHMAFPHPRQSLPRTAKDLIRVTWQADEIGEMLLRLGIPVENREPK